MFKAVIFGSIGAFAETSELQRQAFNAAFAENDLGLNWDEAQYRELLQISGGRARLKHVLGDRLSDDEIAALHARKTELFGQRLAAANDVLRPGFEDLVEALRKDGVQTAIASGTDPRSIDAILATSKRIGPDSFDVIVSGADASRPKPDPEVYQICLARLGIEPGQAIAFEDTAISLAAASAAGLVVLAVPGRYTSSQDVSAASAMLDDYADLSGIDSIVALARS